MPVRIQDLTGNKPLTIESAIHWVRQSGYEFPNNNTTPNILPLFLANWNKTYGFLQCSIFLSHLEMYVEQVELLRGIRDLGDQILTSYPTQVYLYVGIGRSPTPLIAYFQNLRIRTLTIPLSNFRPRNVTWSITDSVMRRQTFGGARDQARILPNQQSALFRHFDSYFQGMPSRNRVLLIDYTQSGQSLVAAQEQLQLFFQSRSHNIEVHALALCRDSDEPLVRGIGLEVSAVRSFFQNPFDWWSFSDQRQSFSRRWHVLPIAEEHPHTKRQKLMMSALSRQTFDVFAEYDSFPILDQDPNVSPTKYTNNPNEPAAYDVLRDELRHI